MTLSSISKPPRMVSSMLIFSSLFSGSALASSPTNLDAQRDLYDQAQQILDGKRLDEFRPIRKQLDAYPLTPYLDYRAFLINLGDKSPIVVRNFIDSHEEYPFSGRISAPYLSALARNGKWGEFLQFQPGEPWGETYQCHYYNAQYQAGDRSLALKGGKKLWLNGHSVSDACDPLFSAMEKSGQVTDAMIRQRMILAFEGRNRALMVYLSKKLNSSKNWAMAQAMLDLYDKPETVADFSRQQPVTNDDIRLVQAALEKIARSDAAKAQALVPSVATLQKWSDVQRQEMSEYVARRLMNLDVEDNLAGWRDEVISQSHNVGLIESRIRLSLQDNDWQSVKRWIQVLPESERATPRWQYWLGRIEMKEGHQSQAAERMKAITGQRNFYSVAAARALHQSVHYPVETIAYQPERVKPYHKALSRIEELINRDKIAAAKSEWRWLLSRVSHQEKEMLAVYAANRNWHHLTVAASIAAKMWNNILLRFPVAHQWWFNFYGEKHGINPITLMSLARQESALDSEARSPVGARGIMQIMPSTAKYTAKKYQITYNGADDLYEVGKNIEIGSHYLNGLLQDYDGNRIFAFAAYNAGPHRVKRWREATDGKLDAYGFIEAIPFNETRGYVQNILMFETYYRDLLGVDGEFLTKEELNTRY